jgi:ATP-dependent Clp protease ATP-binding subunit ClpC
MFERYTEKARRTIFFARYEASIRGVEFIGTPHFLLGMMRENKALFTELLGDLGKLAELTNAVEAVSPKVKGTSSTSADMPLDHATKRALAYAAEEESRTNSAQIDVAHLLAGLIRENRPEVAQLAAFGITLKTIREWRARQPQPGMSRRHLYGLIDDVPASRMAAAQALLTALSAEGACAISGVGPNGPFSFSFPAEGETATPE